MRRRSSSTRRATTTSVPSLRLCVRADARAQPAYMLMLSAELANEASNVDIRRVAGVAMKNALSAKVPSRTRAAARAPLTRPSAGDRAAAGLLRALARARPGHQGPDQGPGPRHALVPEPARGRARGDGRRRRRRRRAPAAAVERPDRRPARLHERPGPGQPPHLDALRHRLHLRANRASACATRRGGVCSRCCDRNRRC
jgi:hypothetical protein